VFHFKATPLQLVWADDEGLWMRNSTGGTVLGAYGGSATKSWAGLTLAPSDVAIGDSARGAYFLWDDSAGTLLLGKTGSTTSNLLLSGTDLSFRVNATERVSLTGAGVLALKDSSGVTRISLNASQGFSVLDTSSVERFQVTTGGVVNLKDSSGNARVVLDASAGIQIKTTAGVNRISLNSSGTLDILDSAATVRIRLDASAGFSVRDNAGTERISIGSGTVAIKDSSAVTRISMNASQGFSVLDASSVERFGISAAGVTTIKDSGGAAVFTFDGSAGAEFTKPLTLGASGGIYQGSGTFASPTTGLKIFRSSSIGKLSTYNSGVEQVTLDTDGKLKAGAGAVVLDANGLSLTEGTGATNFIKWVDGSTTLAHMFTSGAANVSSEFNLFVGSSDDIDGVINLDAHSAGGLTRTLIEMDGGAQTLDLYANDGEAMGHIALTATGTTIHGDTTIDSGDTTLDGTATINGSVTLAGSGVLGIGVALASIKGNFHIYRNSGGFMHFTATGINATPTVVIPNGTGDVTKTVRCYSINVHSTAGGFNQGSFLIDLAGIDTQTDIYAVASDTLTARLLSNGQFEVYRRAGTGTYTVNMTVQWI
jgi:hypothetical protein